LKEEEPGEMGHEFNMLIFKTDKYEEMSEIPFGLVEFDSYLASTLLDYGMESFKSKTNRP
jgi:hypothetical protein